MVDRVGREGAVCAVGGGIFALRRPRPYSRHCGDINARRSSESQSGALIATRRAATVCVNQAAPYAPSHTSVHALYLRRTCVTPGSLHPRILPRNPRVQRRWYDDGTAMEGGW